MKKKKKNKKKKTFSEIGSTDVEFFKGGGGGESQSPRDVVHEPEGVHVSGVHDRGDLGKPPGAVSLSMIEVLDAVSEGPIEGLASGEYELSGYADETGYRKAIFKPHVRNADGTTSQSGWARSVYYNGVQVMSKAGNRNFQHVDVASSLGSPVGENLILDSSSSDKLEIQRSIGERLRGPELKYKDSSYSADSMVLKDSQDPKGRSTGLPKIYNIVNKRCKAFKVVVRVSMLSETLMTGSTEKGAAVGKGDVKATSVTYRIDYRPYFSDDSKNEEFFTVGSDGKIIQDESNVVSETIHGKLTDGYARETRVDVDTSRYLADMEDEDFIGWRIAIYRETFDSFRGSLRNQTHVDSIAEIYEEKFCYPNTAFVRHRFRADSFGSIPQRTHLLNGMRVKVPNNYNTIMRSYGSLRGGETAIGAANGGDWFLDNVYDSDGTKYKTSTDEVWDGNWKRNVDGTLRKEWTQNPAWIFQDIISNKRYGLGNYIADNQIDKWSMYEIAKYCDQLVPNGSIASSTDDEPGKDFGECRFTANIFISNQEDAFTVLNNFASVFRGLTFYSAGKLQATHDAPKTPTFLFNNSNVANGEFLYSSSAKKARHTVCLVRYNDEENKFKPSIEYIEDVDSIKKYGIRVKDITSFGTTTKSQAQRWGQWSLATERMETETVNFTAGIEGAYLQAGDVVATSDEHRGTYENTRARRRGGRCFFFESNSGSNMDGAPNWTGRAVLDSTISGWINGGSSYTIPDTGPKSILDFNIVTPPAYGDSLTTNMTSSSLAEVFNRKAALQSLKFNKSDVTETGSYGGELYADGEPVVGTRTIIEFTGLYHQGVNVLDTENFNVTGFTGLLYDAEGEVVLNNSNPSGFVESKPDSFVWAVEYTGALLQGHGAKPDKELWKVINVGEKAGFKYNVQAVRHDPNKFDFVDKRLEPLVEVAAGLPDPPTNLNLSNVTTVPGLTAKKVTYTFSRPSASDDDIVHLKGYRVYIKRDADFDATDDFTEDIYGVHPDGRYASKYIPDTADLITSTFIPFINGTYYFRVYSINKYGRSRSKSEYAGGSVTINGINLIQDLSVSALSLAGVADMTDFSSRVSEVANYATSNENNAAGTKDGWPYYNLQDINLEWQCGFKGDPASLAGLSIPQMYTYRITFRRPDKTSDIPYVGSSEIFHEETGQSPSDLNYTLSMADNMAMSLPANYNFGPVFGDDVTPLRAMDVVVEAIDQDGNSSAGGSVVYNGAGELTQDSTYTNADGFDILYVENSPPSGIRLTKRVASQAGEFVENCTNTTNTNEFCTDQWLNADGTLNFILKRDTPGFVTGEADITNAVFLLSRNSFESSHIQSMLYSGIINNSAVTEMSSPQSLDDGNKDSNLIMGQGWVSQADYQLTVPTPYQNIMSEITRGDVGAFTHLHLAIGFVDNFLERAIIDNPGKKDLLKKIVWSDNVVKIGARNAFLAGSLSWRAWAVLNVNWDSRDNLNYHIGGFDTIALTDYCGSYQIRRAWSTGGKSPETKYNYTNIKALRKARKFIFQDPQPSDQYEVVVLFSQTAKWGTSSNNTVPIYGDTSPQLEIDVLEKTREYFVIKDTSLGGFQQGGRPLKGNLFVGVLLGAPFPPDGGDLGGFGTTNADLEFSYSFDTWDTTRTTSVTNDCTLDTITTHTLN